MYPLISLRRVAHYGEVDTGFVELAYKGIVAPYDYFYLYAGIIMAEFFYYLREPQYRRAGKSAYAELTEVHSPDIGNYLVHMVVGIEYFPYGRKQNLTVFGQPHAALTAYQNREAKFVLYGPDKVADAGLGKAKLVSSGGKTFGLYDFKKDFKLFDIHSRHFAPFGK